MSRVCRVQTGGHELERRPAAAEGRGSGGSGRSRRRRRASAATTRRCRSSNIAATCCTVCSGCGALKGPPAASNCGTLVPTPRFACDSMSRFSQLQRQGAIASTASAWGAVHEAPCPRALCRSVALPTVFCAPIRAAHFSSYLPAASVPTRRRSKPKGALGRAPAPCAACLTQPKTPCGQA